MATMYSRRNSALLIPVAELLGRGEVVGSEEERKEKTWSSRRIQRRAREIRCGVEENWVGVGGWR
jgi:hypothetical protein